MKPIKIRGDKKLIANLMKIAATNPVAVGTVLYQEGLAIMNDSKENYVPVMDSDLKSSGHVELPKIGVKGATVELGYGGAASEYALKVHENPRAGKTGGISPQGKKYKKWAKVGQWKYLETPVNNAAKTMAIKLAAGLRIHLKRFGK